jgi:hypothetical protein
MIPSPAPFYLSIVSNVPSSGRPRFQERITWLKHQVEKFEWKQVAFCSTLTDVPENYFEVYQIQDIKFLPTVRAKLETETEYRSLLRLCASRQMELTHGMPYDPGAGGPSGPKEDGQDYFLLTNFTLKADQLPLFINATQEVLKVFFEQCWRLVFASQSISLPQRVTHLWRLRDASCLRVVSKLLMKDSRYARIDGCCESQWQRLLRQFVGMEVERR